MLKESDAQEVDNVMIMMTIVNFVDDNGDDGVEVMMPRMRNMLKETDAQEVDYDYCHHIDYDDYDDDNGYDSDDARDEEHPQEIIFSMMIAM